MTLDLPGMAFCVVSLRIIVIIEPGELCCTLGVVCSLEQIGSCLTRFVHLKSKVLFPKV